MSCIAGCPGLDCADPEQTAQIVRRSSADHPQIAPIAPIVMGARDCLHAPSQEHGGRSWEEQDQQTRLSYKNSRGTQHEPKHEQQQKQKQQQELQQEQQQQ
jgi:hypothetical protein